MLMRFHVFVGSDLSGLSVVVALGVELDVLADHVIHPALHVPSHPAPHVPLAADKLQSSNKYEHSEQSPGPDDDPHNNSPVHLPLENTHTLVGLDVAPAGGGWLGQGVADVVEDELTL